ncbi:MAG: M48 family metalloprotease [Alphaproteobacteria bacterium]|nr:M48 family metalloprotease [Alphaproteobacteria bacterium]
MPRKTTQTKGPARKRALLLSTRRAGRIFAFCALFALLACTALFAAPSPARAAAPPFAILRDAETEHDLKIFTRGIFEQAGISPSAVRFVLVNDSDLNAFVAGGQNIFLNTGLILATQNPAELIGVIAHESGHIACGHLLRSKYAMQDLSLQAMLGTLIGIAAAIGAHNGNVGMASADAARAITLRQMLRHSRIQETAADTAGVRFLEGAHLPVTGFLSFMKKLENQELLPESEQSEYVQTHPLTRDRITFLENAVAADKDKDAQVPPEWVEMHARLKSKLLGYLYPERALQDRGDSVASRYGRVIATYRLNKPDAAIKLLDPLIEKAPGDPYFEELKGQILFESGKVEASLPDYARAVKNAPDAALIRTAYGHALVEAASTPEEGTQKQTAERLQEAVRQFELALRSEPDSAETRHFLAIAYGKQGKEGLSRLQLAEEALITGNDEFARREAGLAAAALPKHSPGWLRSQDILELADKNLKKKKKGD